MCDLVRSQTTDSDGDMHKVIYFIANVAVVAHTVIIE